MECCLISVAMATKQRKRRRGQNEQKKHLHNSQARKWFTEWKVERFNFRISYHITYSYPPLTVPGVQEKLFWNIFCYYKKQPGCPLSVVFTASMQTILTNTHNIYSAINHFSLYFFVLQLRIFFFHLFLRQDLEVWVVEGRDSDARNLKLWKLNYLSIDENILTYDVALKLTAAHFGIPILN